MLLGKSGWPCVSKLDCLAPPMCRVPADMVWRPRSLCPLELILGSFCWSRPGAWHTGIVTVFGMCAKGSVKEQMNDQQVLIPGQIHQPSADGWTYLLYVHFNREAVLAHSCDVSAQHF